jgi:hypothetical protein
MCPPIRGRKMVSALAAVVVNAPPSVQFEKGGVRLFRRDRASSYGFWGNIAVVLGRQPPDATHVANYRACVVELHRRYPQGVGLITVVNDASTPSPSGRDAMINMFKATWPMMTAVLFVPNASGFKAAVLRSVMGGLILATGQRDRVRVEPSVQAGAPWLFEKVLGAAEGRRQGAHLQRGIIEFCDAESQHLDSVPMSR